MIHTAFAYNASQRIPQAKISPLDVLQFAILVLKRERPAQKLRKTDTKCTEAAYLHPSPYTPRGHLVTKFNQIPRRDNTWAIGKAALVVTLKEVCEDGYTAYPVFICVKNTSLKTCIRLFDANSTGLHDIPDIQQSEIGPEIRRSRRPQMFPAVLQ